MMATPPVPAPATVADVPASGSGSNVARKAPQFSTDSRDGKKKVDK